MGIVSCTPLVHTVFVAVLVVLDVVEDSLLLRLLTGNVHDDPIQTFPHRQTIAMVRRERHLAARDKSACSARKRLRQSDQPSSVPAVIVSDGSENTYKGGFVLYRTGPASNDVLSTNFQFRSS
jgi:hypothetical protein